MKKEITLYEDDIKKIIAEKFNTVFDNVFIRVRPNKNNDGNEGPTVTIKIETELQNYDL